MTAFPPPWFSPFSSVLGFGLTTSLGVEAFGGGGKGGGGGGGTLDSARFLSNNVRFILYCVACAASKKINNHMSIFLTYVFLCVQEEPQLGKTHTTSAPEKEVEKMQSDINFTDEMFV